MSTPPPRPGSVLQRHGSGLRLVHIQDRFSTSYISPKYLFQTAFHGNGAGATNITVFTPRAYLQAVVDHLAGQHGGGGGAITRGVVGAASNLPGWVKREQGRHGDTLRGPHHVARVQGSPGGWVPSAGRGPVVAGHSALTGSAGVVPAHPRPSRELVPVGSAPGWCLKVGRRGLACGEHALGCPCAAAVASRRQWLQWSSRLWKAVNADVTSASDKLLQQPPTGKHWHLSPAAAAPHSCTCSCMKNGCCSILLSPPP